MGGPSREELLSDEFVSKWIDNEFDNEIERHFFENLLEEEGRFLDDPYLSEKFSTKVISRVEQQSAAKLAVSELVRGDNLQPSDTVKSEIRKLVHSSLKKVGMEKIQDTEDEFENIRLQDDRFIISQYIDEELDVNSFSESNIKEIIKSSRENTLFYRDLVRMKSLTKSLIDTKNLEPTDNVAKEIRNLVASMENQGEENTESPIRASARYDRMAPPHAPALSDANEAYAASEYTDNDRWDKIGLEDADNTTFKVNWFNFKKYSMPSVPQMASLAAVFAVGLVVSPTLYETIKPRSDADRIVLRGGSDTPLTEENTNELISFKQESNESLEISSSMAGSKAIASNIPFTLQFIVPISGDVSIYVNASVENDTKLVTQGEKYELGYFGKNSIIKFPETRALKVEQEDQLLRVDFNIQNGNEDFLITRWFKIDYSVIETIKPGE